MDASAPTPGRRLFVYGFFALLLAGGWWSIEAYPLTGWHFFSGAKRGEYHEWSVVAVDDGEESAIRFSDLPAGHHHTTALLDDLDSLTGDEVEAVCAAWAAPLREDGVDVDVLRIYRVDVETTADGPQEVRRSIERSCPV